MSLTSRPLWIEGMFMRPQHLQQQGRYLEALIERRALAARLFGWGVRHLVLDANLLRLGRVGLAACEAVMPDGTPVSIPGDMDPPPARDIPAGLRHAVVKLAMPVGPGDAVELAAEGSDDHGGAGRTARYRAASQEVRDATSPGRAAATVQVGVPRLRLLLEGENEDDLACLPVARIDGVDAAGAVTLAPSFIPPAAECAAVPRLMEIVGEVEGLLHSLGDALAARIDPAQPARDIAGVSDYLLLATINRYEPLFSNLRRTAGTHPQDLHGAMLMLAGELATYGPGGGRTNRRPAAFPPYRHDAIEPTLEPVVAAIRAGLMVAMDERVVSIPLEPQNYGIWLGALADKSLLRDSRFVLAAKADMPSETLRSQFPMQVKVGPVEVIRDLVNLQLPGIVLQPLGVVPRELPFYGGYGYFELSRDGDLWSRMANSAAFALHVGADFGSLAMELWAIRAVRR